MYPVELSGLALALQMVLDIHGTTNRPGKCAIFTDNQAAIRAIQDPKSPPGQYILAEAIQALDILRNHCWMIEFRWILAHVACQAAKWPTKRLRRRRVPTPSRRPSRRPRGSHGDYEDHHSPGAARYGEKAWETIKHGRELFRFGMRPSKATLDTQIGTHRAINSMVTQMRTGKISLGAYLHSIDKADTNECQCGRGAIPGLAVHRTPICIVDER